MGKKDKNKKKGKGAEKTAAKTDKKLSQKQKKELAAIGEDDIEKILAEIEEEEAKRLQVTEQIVEPPTRRANFTLISHPFKEELIFFGGEYFNGQKTFLYNDLYFYTIQKNEWTLLKAPAGPPPRCGHQMVALPVDKGQLWLFGGEFASCTQNQFYHYKDLWVYHMSTKRWEKVESLGCPTSRSGHRMVCSKRNLIIFGGFHDNLRDYKYFNDVYFFNLDDYKWSKIEPSGIPPSPRSGCIMISLPDGKILIYGGYSKEKIKKDVDKGHVHTDMFLLSPEKGDMTGKKWKWVTVKSSGIKISPRCGMSVVATGNKAYVFGGVWDVEEEDEEDIAGTFYNEMFCLDLETNTWRTVTLSGKRDTAKIKRRRRKKSENDDNEGEEESECSDEEDDKSLPVEETAHATVVEDGIFTMTIGPASEKSEAGAEASSLPENIFMPSPRMNCGLAVKHGQLYLYGGLMEDGNKQITFSDFYTLDLKKLDEWKTIIANDLEQEWLDSSSESGEEEEEEEEDGDDDDAVAEDEDPK